MPDKVKSRHLSPTGVVDHPSFDPSISALEQINLQREAEGLRLLGLNAVDAEDIADIELPTKGGPEGETPKIGAELATRFVSDVNAAIIMHLARRQTAADFGGVAEARRALECAVGATRSLRQALDGLPPRAIENIRLATNGGTVRELSRLRSSLSDAEEALRAGLVDAAKVSAKSPDLPIKQFAADVVLACRAAKIQVTLTRATDYQNYDGPYAQLLKLALEAAGETSPKDIFPLMKAAIERAGSIVFDDGNVDIVQQPPSSCRCRSRHFRSRRRMLRPSLQA